MITPLHLPREDVGVIKELPDQDPVLIAGAVRVGLEPPVVDELLLLEDPQNRVGVPDVNDQQHRAPLSSPLAGALPPPAPDKPDLTPLS
jgi:hypothetical protein